MSTWLSRNAAPIASVLLASAVVIGGFELIDAVTASGPAEAEGAEAEMEGIASLAGLIKVSLFLAVGALIAIPIRRRL